jgi:hypothetical protein
MTSGPIDKGKIVSFVLFTFGAGLLQMWILFFALYFSNKSPTLEALLGDGGLYFFSTALVYSSLVSLISHTALKFGDSYLNITFITVSPVTLIAIVAYVSVLFSNIGKLASPFANHIIPQLSCLTLSMTYAFYVATVAGVFKK